MAKRETTPAFKAMYKQSAALTVATQPILPASTAPGVEHPGFDDDDVKTALGITRYNALMAAIVSGAPGYSGSVFSCGHRVKNGVEVHCIYASDLELFLKNGG